MKNDLSSSRLKELLTYNESTGEFTRLCRAGRRLAGEIAGTIQSCGYVSVRIDRRFYLAHRLAFLYMTGEWPKHCVDHVDGIRTNNAWANLREATHTQNMQNFPLRHPKTKRETGGYFSNSANKWQATIRVQGRRVFLGSYDSHEAANAAYLKAKKSLHEFRRSN